MIKNPEVYFKEPVDILKVENDPLLIIASPGTGKSTKLAERARKLLDKHLVGINNLFVLSFSNESVDDLRGKLDKAKVPNNVWCSTVHKLAYKALLENLDETGMNNSFTITDREDDILICQDSNFGKIDYSLAKKQIFEIYQMLSQLNSNVITQNSQYYKYKNFYNGYSFYDITYKVNQLLKLKGEVRKQYFERIRFLLVDEYQDLNKADQEFIDLLTNSGRGLTICGDDDQSIYAFRFAYPDGIRERYNSGKFLIGTMEDCKRSPSYIVNIANYLRKLDKDSIPKRLIKEKSSFKGQIISLPSSRVNRNKEAEWVMSQLEKEINEVNSNKKIKDEFKILILASEDKVFYALKKLLKNKKISFKSRKIKLLESRFNRLIYHIIRFIKNKNDSLALRWIIHQLEKNPSGIYTIIDKAITEKVSLWQALLLYKNCNEKWISRLIELGENFLKINLEQEPSEVISKIIKIIGHKEDDKEVTELLKITNKIECIEDLFDLVSSENLDPADIETGPLEKKRKISIELLTAHSSKGLSADVVFIMGLENGLFPKESKFTMNELRLFYVAITRTRNKLFMTYVRSRADNVSRNIYGKRFRSEFLNLIFKMPNWKEYLDFSKLN
jgi:superfamily I DNA/RNA helicase